MAVETAAPRKRRIGLWLMLALFILVDVVYWQDPWLWRNYVRFFTSGDPLGQEILPPDEEIRGDGSYVLPVAAAAGGTIAAAALEDMHRYAAVFGTHALIVAQDGGLGRDRFANGRGQKNRGGAYAFGTRRYTY